MRNCDNCIFSSLALDCNTGIETLYCNEIEYEFEVETTDTCEEHQYIEGLEEEKNYILYDKNYLGPGYFIINMQNNEISKFIKIYTTNNDGFPHYSIRAFSPNAKDKPEETFTNIEFTFRDIEDYKNGLYEAFNDLYKNINSNIETIDPRQQGKNNISFVSTTKTIKVIFSKDIWHGKQHPTDFIDINLGDNYSCKNYDAINQFYNSLAYITPNQAKKQDIEKILELKVK